METIKKMLYFEMKINELLKIYNENLKEIILKDLLNQQQQQEETEEEKNKRKLKEEEEWIKSYFNKMKELNEERQKQGIKRVEIIKEDI